MIEGCFIPREKNNRKSSKILFFPQVIECRSKKLLHYIKMENRLHFRNKKKKDQKLKIISFVYDTFLTAPHYI